MKQINDKIVRNVLNNSVKYAINNKNEYVTTEHILYFFLEIDEAKSLLEKIKSGSSNIIRENLKFIIDNYVTKNNRPKNFEFGELFSCIPIITENVVSVLEKIIIKTLNDDNTKEVTIWRFLKEILDSDSLSSEILKKYLKITSEDFDKFVNDEYNVDCNSIDGTSLSSNLSMEEAEKIIKKYSVLLNDEIKNHHPIVGREKEIFEINKVLGRKTKNNVILVGDSGVGKTAVVYGLVMKYVSGDVPETSNLKNTKVYSLDVTSLMAGTKFRGELEERLENIIKSLSLLRKKMKNPPILFIDEIHMLIGAGTSSEHQTFDIANMLKPYLSNGTLRVIGTTTPEEYRKYIEKDSAFTRRFHIVNVFEPTVEDTIKIINGIISHFEEHHKVKYDQNAIEKAVMFSKKFISKNRLPDKAIDIIDAAASKNNLKSEEERSDIITEEHIIDEISYVTKIPVAKITEKQTDKIRNLESNLKQSIFGQNEAIEALVDRIYISQAGLKDSTRPDAIFMFNGPTGVGKTELAKKLAECLDMSFIRIDMSEYMEKHSVSKLIGAPPGYVGFNDGKIGNGLLINYIEDNPFSVVLFDEVEKAHPDVWNIFLQIFDYGSLTSSNGKKVSFSNSIIIMTSNIGSRYVGKLQIGFNREETGAEIQDEMVKNSLPPELINRIDQIITFNHLDNDVINMIIDKFIKELEIKLQNKNVNIVLTEKAREYLIEKGYNRVFGARPMKRLIDSKISTKLARKILFDNVDDQKMTFTIDVVQNDIVVL